MKKLTKLLAIAGLSFALFLLYSTQVAAQSDYTGAADPKGSGVEMDKPVQDYSYKYQPPSGREGGEDIPTAIPIPGLPYNDTGYTCDNLDDYDEVCPYSGSTSPDVVYSYTPTENELIDIDLCNSLYDTKVFVYENTAGNLVACNDDACGSSGWQSRLDLVSLTAGNTYYIVIDGYGGDCGDYDLTVSGHEPPWCIGYCAPGSIPEGEGDIPDNGEDNFNGGCNTPPLYPFSPIDFDQVVCGRSNTYLYSGSQYRDTDWYEITVTEAGVLYWTGMANFDLLLFIIEGDCNTTPVLASNSNGGNCNEVQISASVGPGTYYLWAGPSFFSGLEQGENYNVVATFNGPPPPDWATAVVPVSNWALFIAIGLIAALVLFRFWRRN